MQRVAAGARALVARPSIILADERPRNLDSHSSTEVLDLLRSLSDEDGAAVVMVTHDEAAARYGSRELHLVDGRASAIDAGAHREAVDAKAAAPDGCLFGRIHLAALIADWRSTLLSVIGVALGVTVVLGTLFSNPSSLGRSIHSALAHPAADRGWSRSPERQRPVADRDGSTDCARRCQRRRRHSDRRRPDASGRRRRHHGYFLLGGSCQIELLVGPFTASSAPATRSPPTGPACQLQIPAVIAERHGLQLGEELRIPGLPADRRTWVGRPGVRTAVEGINDGYVLLAHPGTSPRAFSPRPVMPRRRSSCEAGR